MKVGNGLKFIAFVMSVMLMTSCTHRESSSNRLLYIQALGIDSDQSGMISCTTQIFDPALGAATIQEQSESITKVVRTSGKSITQAVFNISEQIGKKPYYTQNKVIVIGQELAKSGIKPYMDYFDRDWETRLTMQVVIGSPDADGIVSATLGNVINPAQEVALAAQSGNLNGDVPECTLLDLKRALVNKYEGFCVPVVSIEGEEEESHTEIDSIAVFDNDAICGYITPEQARGVMYINDEIKNCLEVVDVKGIGKVSLEITSSNSRIKTKFDGDRIVCNVKIKCNAAVTEINFDSDQTGVTNNLDEIETALERHITGLMQDASSTALQKLNCDIFSINRQLRQDQQVWRQVSGDWKEYLKNADVLFDVQASVSRIGETTG